MTMAELTTFLGWCTLLNVGMLAFSSLMLFGGGSRIAKIHAKMFDLEPSQLPAAYFQYLAQYKIGILLLNIAPYIALKLMN